ncbi:MAG: hypothetical protein HY299_08260 [Verrucomicrobia bacterium]|nr:hypothetical protein [Verrucomicrobiota bacterium]
MAADLCSITVVEQGSGWPVPLVELRTTHLSRWVTDNAGVVAFDAPELMGRETWFDVRADGYEVPRDGFGMQGVRLRPAPGATLRVEVRRTSLARRLGRLTGAGLFAENQKLGLRSEWKESGVLGCDSVQVAAHRGRLFWAWGDTTLARYPLGIFDMLGATSSAAIWTNLAPPIAFAFDLFRDGEAQLRGVARLPGSGPTWLSGCVSLPDRMRRSRLVAAYMKIKPPLEAYETGLCVWNEEKASFERLKATWSRGAGKDSKPAMPEGHASLWTDASGIQWVYFGNPLPTLRCRASFEAWEDPSAWESLRPQETLASAADGKAIKPHSGSIAWNAHRGRWVAVFMEAFGRPSAFGELWYSEAPAPQGPWGPAVKVLSHAHYTFYNPRLHPELTAPDSSVLLFEGTYTQQFSDVKEPTPRYDYNQILYSLDLNDAGLRPAGAR